MSGRQERPVAATVWVGNLPFETTDSELHALMSQAGAIKNLRLIMDRETGKPKGFGFCEFFDKATAESAYRNLNNTDFKGRPVRIDYAEEEMTERDRKVRSARAGGERPDRGPPPIGYKAAAGSAAQVSSLLGGPPASDLRIQEQLNDLLASKSKPELWEVLRHLKEFLQADRATAHHYFSERPGLSKVVFQAQVLLGMVKPLGGAFPVTAGYPPEQGRLGGPPPPPPRSAGGPIGLPPGAVLSQGPMTQVVVVDASGQQQTVMMPASQLGALGVGQPGIQLAPGAPVAMPGQPEGLVHHPLQQQPLQQVQLHQQPLQQVAVQQAQPVLQQQPVVVQQQQQPAPAGAAAGPFAGQDPAQLQALLQQVQTMTDEQINGLPEHFKQQVLYVKAQIAAGAKLF